MLGRTPEHITTVRPLRDGVIADFDNAERMLRYFVGRVHRRSFWSRPRIVVAVPSGITGVERRAVRDACYSAGAREVHLMEEPMAAAIGAGLPVHEATGSMVVDIGGGTTEVAVLALGGTVVSLSVRVGGDRLDEAIIAYAKKEYSLLIGERTAEDVKVAVGSAFPSAEEPGAQVRGRDLVTGMPRTIEMSAEEIRWALDEPVQAIVGRGRRHPGPDTAGARGGRDGPGDHADRRRGAALRDGPTSGQRDGDPRARRRAAAGRRGPGRGSCRGVLRRAGARPAAGAADLMAWRRGRVLLLVCLVVALLLVLADVRGAAPTQALRGAAGAVTGPVEQGLAWVRTQAAQRLGGSAQEQARIAELEAQLEAARAAAGAAAAGTLDADSVRELAAAAPASGFTPVPARLVALSTPQDQTRSATISAGSGVGVAAGLAVLAPAGLAGLVDSVAPRVSTVRLVVDPATAITARVASSGEVGIFRGTGRAGSFELLDPLGTMAPGDLVVTLGTADGNLPADLALGRISTISGSAADLSRVAEVVPAVDDSTLDRLAVLLPEPTS